MIAQPFLWPIETGRGAVRRCFRRYTLAGTLGAVDMETGPRESCRPHRAGHCQQRDAGSTSSSAILMVHWR